MSIDRHAVYEKLNGRCGYCGNPIEYKDMQVDHVFPKCNGGADTIDNLMPSCRLCNHYKRAHNLDDFRWLIVDMLRKLRKIYIFKVAEKYGMLTWNDWDGKFFFETVEEAK